VAMGIQNYYYQKSNRILTKFDLGPVIRVVNEPEPELKGVYIKLPYCGPNSERIKKGLVNCIRGVSNNNVKVNVLFKQKKMSSMFNVKDKYSMGYENNSIYKISCPDCNAEYVGETNRRLTDRFSEHLRPSFGGNPGTFFKHCQDTGHSLPDFDSNCKVVAKETSFYKRKIKESIIIKKINPTLNSNITSFPLELF